MHPYSSPQAQISTDDGHWIFSGEGGALSFIEFGARSPATASPGSLKQAMPAQTKRIPIGSLGVMAADMVLDPAADLSDDSALGSPGPEDRRDLLYVAGGHLGLWAMEAHPGATHANESARLDDSQSGTPNASDSGRFCTAVETVRIGAQTYLLALFAGADDNILRVYPIEYARLALSRARAAGVGDVGFEIPAVREVRFGAHPLETPDVFENGTRVTRGRSYAISMDVDRGVSSKPGPKMEPRYADVYIATMTSGVLRVRLSEGLFAVGAGSPQLRARKQWGPLFGDGTPHGTTVGGGLNGSGFPADWYRNRIWRSAARSAEFGETLRNDPPHFLDVAVQNDGGGHFLYAAVDHLGWVRFSLGEKFTPSIEIHHHEGIPSRSHPGSTGRPAGDYTRWLRQVDLDAAGPNRTGAAFEPADLDGTPERNVKYASRVELTRVGSGGNERTALVVGYQGDPWSRNARVRGPGRQLDQTFAQIGGYDFESTELYDKGKVPAPNLDVTNPGAPAQPVGYADIPILAVYDDVANLTKLHVGQVSTSTPNLDRWIPVGVNSIHVLPSEPAPGELLRVLHSTGILGDFGVPSTTPNFPLATYSVGVSFFDLSAGANPVARLPVWLRETDEMTGRYAFGAAFSAADPRVVTQSFNDIPVRPDGLVWTDALESGSGSLAVMANPSPGSRDRRLDTGVIFDEESRWLDAPNREWTIGGRADSSGAGWAFGEHLFQLAAGTAAPLVDLVRSVTVESPEDRYGTPLRDYYMGGTTDPGFDGFTAANAPVGAAASTFAFLCRAVTLDGLQVVGREPLLQSFPPGGGVIPFEDPRQLPPPANPWTSFSLNTHPEWDNVPFDASIAPPATDPLREYARGEQFWATRLPLAETASLFTFPADAVRLPGHGSGGWILGVPSGFASCPPNLDQLIAGPVAIDPAQPFGGPLDFLPISPSFRPTPAWGNQFRKGACVLFDMDDPWQRAAEATVNGAPLPGTVYQRPPGSSGLDPLFLSREGSSAFGLEFATLLDGSGGEHVLAFVADFSGAVEVFDVTNIRSQSIGPRAPIASWVAPPDLLEGLTPNVYDVELDPIGGGRLNVYVSASRGGVYVTAFELATGFTPAPESLRIKTAGEAHSCAIRTSAKGKLLLVGDLSGGYRFFGL